MPGLYSVLSMVLRTVGGGIGKEVLEVACIPVCLHSIWLAYTERNAFRWHRKPY